MSTFDRNNIQDILRQIGEKITLLKDKAKEIANRKEVEVQVKKLEKHKRQIENELEKAGIGLQKRCQESQPLLQEAAHAMSKAFNILLGNTKTPSTPEKKANASTKKTTSKQATDTGSNKKSATRGKKSTTTKKGSTKSS